MEEYSTMVRTSQVRIADSVQKNRHPECTLTISRTRTLDQQNELHTSTGKSSTRSVVKLIVHQSNNILSGLTGRMFPKGYISSGRHRPLHTLAF